MSEEKESSREYKGKESNDDESISPLSPIPVDESMSTTGRNKGDGEWMNDLLLYFETKSLATECHISQAMMSLETNAMSGVNSDVIDSVAMLSLDALDLKDDPQYGAVVGNTGETGCQGQEERYPSLCCIHEGPLSNVYRLADPTNKHGGKTNAIAIKILSDQFPDKAHIARLDRERLSMTEIDDVIDKGGGEPNSSRVLCLEWLPGVTLREWVQVSNSADINGIKHNLKLSIHLAWQIAHSLSEIHEVGGAILNNISSENIIVNSLQNEKDICTVHMIGIGLASFLREGQPEGSLHEGQKEVK
eukprot:7517276-Ditylum_brightwellii.AAC.1